MNPILAAQLETSATGLSTGDAPEMPRRKTHAQVAISEVRAHPVLRLRQGTAMEGAHEASRHGSDYHHHDVLLRSKTMPETDNGWEWWAGTQEEWMTIGPCATRDDAIAEMVHDGAGEWLDDSVDPPVWRNSFYVIEARQDPLRVADWVDADWIIEKAEENLSNSDRVGAENDDGPWFECSKELEADLAARLKKACDDWQRDHGLVFTCQTFSHSRNCEQITTDALRLVEPAKDQNHE